MNVVVRRAMSREEFLRWDGHLEGRYEFDGEQPVAMTGGTLRHDRLTGQLLYELRRRLSGRPCDPFGPNAGIATVGSAVRYPDALVTCSKPESDLVRLVPDSVVVFEVTSPSSGYVDRVVKLHEYAAVPTIRRYVMVESEMRAVTVFHRDVGETPFRAAGLGEDQVLQMPEIEVEMAVAAIYHGSAVPPIGRER